MRYFSLFLLCFSLVAAVDDRTVQSPANKRIAAASKAVQANVKSPDSYNNLAAALCRKARDNDDIALYDQAEKALQHSLQLSSGDYEAQKLRVAVLIGKHELKQALQLATELNNKTPDDISGWGLLVDVNTALGNYAEAERDAQWILDLRRDSALGFEKAAGMRELFGDFEGAIEFYNETILRTSQNDADERAWLLTQNARLQLMMGNAKGAGELLDQAMKLFPDSQFALEILAKLRTADGNYSEAASLLEKRYRTVPSSGNLYEWAEALEKSGQKVQAAAAFQEFETKARAEITKPYNSNLDLIYLYADHKNNPPEALALAMKEASIRHDSAMLAAYAWALYRNGKYADAKTQMDRALAVGTRDPVYLRKAAPIAEMAARKTTQ